MAETVTSEELFSNQPQVFSSEELGIKKPPTWVKIADFLTGHFSTEPEPKTVLQQINEGSKITEESAAVPFLQDPVVAGAFGLASGARAAAPLAGKIVQGAKVAGEWISGGATALPGMAKRGLTKVIGGIEAKNIAPAMESLRGAGKDVPVTVEDVLKGSKVSSLAPVKNIVSSEELLGEAGMANINLIGGGVPAFVQEDVIPTAKNVSTGFMKTGKAIRDAFSPISAGPEARATGGMLRENLGEMVHKGDMTEYSLRSAKKMFDKVEDPIKHDFMNKVELGLDQTNRDFEPIGQTMRQILDTRRDQVQALGTGKLQEFYENYFPHIWKKPDEAQQVFKDWFSKRPMEGSKAFLKQRTVPTIEDGLNWRIYDKEGNIVKTFKPEMVIDAEDIATLREYIPEGGRIGKPLELISNNPVDLVLLKTREMDKYIMAHKTIQGMKDEGLAKFVKANQKPPDGWIKIDDKIATVYAPPEISGKFPSGQKAGVTILGNYYAPEGAARIINNYLSPGLRGNPAFRGYLDAANILNQAQLGMSAFHLGFTTLDAVTSKVALGLNQLSHGDLLKAGKSFAMAPVNLAGGIENILRGNKVLREWYKPGSQGGEIAKIVDGLQKAGGRVQMDRFYATTYTKKMIENFHKGNFLGGTLRLPFVAVEQAMKPIMEYIVPRQKLGVFSDLARYELGRLEGKATQKEITQTLQKVWDSVDNRMGQLVYDNLFWNKTVKDLGMSSVRSLGWNLGTFRELGGGATDLVRQGIKAAKGQAPELTYRMAYTTALPVTIGTIGAITMYAMTGKGPEELKDYFFPKTGRLDKDGNPERLSLPSYMKDLYHYYDNPAQAVKNKLHPLIGMGADMLGNADYYGVEIRNSDDPIMKQALDELKFMGKQTMPFSVQGALKNIERGKTGTGIAGPFVGIMPAPKYINQTPIQNEIFKTNKLRNPTGEKTQFQWEQSLAKREIAQAWKDGDEAKFNQKIKDALDKGYIEDSKSKLKSYLHGSTLPSDIRSFKQLPEQDQERLLKKMSKEEVEKFAWYAHKNLRKRFGDISSKTSEFVGAYQRGELNKPQYRAGYTSMNLEDQGVNQ